ncbi:ABC transporter substrate-binding protein [bacterium]|nr:ABC transporter substrate-binding protein [bacterium]
MSGRARLLIVLALFGVGLLLAYALMPGPPPGAEPGGQPTGDSVPAARRVVSMAPSIVESLFAIGAGSRVVGVGTWCFHPPEAKALPRVGGEADPSFERLLVLQPDLVIAQGRAEKLHGFCVAHGIRILHVNMDSIPTLYAGLRMIGRAVGMPAEADRVAARIRTDLAAVARRVAGRPRPTVFLCMGHRAGSLRGLASTSGRTFLSNVLDVAGGENIFADLQQDYPPISKEALDQRAPQAILDLHPGEELSAAQRRQLLDDWQALPSLPAVAAGRVRILTDDHLLLPGPRVARSAARIAEALHPLAEGGR